MRTTGWLALRHKFRSPAATHAGTARGGPAQRFNRKREAIYKMTQRMKSRQGDVLFLPIDSIPPGTRKPRADGAVAYGEVTGHSHRIADLATADVFEVGDGLYVHVSEDGISISGEPGATVVHEEHGPVTLAPGDYQIRIQQEYSPEAIRNVID
jgi:hypothetical protein